MFFLIWGWQNRRLQLGVLGPFTCRQCSWLGTFWFQRHERRFRLYFIPVTPWWTRQFACVCRNCGSATYLRRQEGEPYLDQVQPLGAPDPFGPAQTPPGPRDDAPPTPPVHVGSDPSETDQTTWDAFAEGNEGRDVGS